MSMPTPLPPSPSFGTIALATAGLVVASGLVYWFAL